MKQASRAASSSTASSGSIGKTTRVTGRISGDGDLLVEGRVDGDVTLGGHFHVGRGGMVTAANGVQAGSITIEGGIDGDVSSRGDVVLRADGRLRGAVKAGRVSLDDGARFSGRIEMDVELPKELGDESHPVHRRGPQDRAQKG
ncbi:MAG: polymer-forming cytoskeletal protein [Polyangiales bacterium]